VFFSAPGRYREHMSGFGVFQEHFGAIFGSFSDCLESFLVLFEEQKSKNSAPGCRAWLLPALDWSGRTFDFREISGAFWDLFGDIW